MTALELMDFDGIEGVKDKVQQGQTLMNVIAELQQKLMTLESMIGVAQPQPVGAIGQTPVGKAEPQKMTYGEKLAQRATPSVDR